MSRHSRSKSRSSSSSVNYGYAPAPVDYEEFGVPAHSLFSCNTLDLPKKYRREWEDYYDYLRKQPSMVSRLPYPQLPPGVPTIPQPPADLIHLFSPHSRSAKSISSPQSYHGEPHHRSFHGTPAPPARSYSTPHPYSSPTSTSTLSSQSSGSSDSEEDYPEYHFDDITGQGFPTGLSSSASMPTKAHTVPMPHKPSTSSSPPLQSSSRDDNLGPLPINPMVSADSTPLPLIVDLRRDAKHAFLRAEPGKLSGKWVKRDQLATFPKRQEMLLISRDFEDFISLKNPNGITCGGFFSSKRLVVALLM